MMLETTLIAVAVILGFASAVLLLALVCWLMQDSPQTPEE